MNISRKLHIAIAVGAIALGTTSLGTANASDCYEPQYRWKTIVVYVDVEVAYKVYVTKYDHCGDAYEVPMIRYKTVTVPVEKRVRVAI